MSLPTDLQSQLKALLDDKEYITKIEILDKQISQKESMIKELDKSLIEYREKVKNSSDDTDEKLDSLNGLLSAKAEEIKLANKVKDNVSQEIKNAKKSLKDVQLEIRDQTIYFNEQEVKINEIVNKWNNQLRDFKEADDEVKLKRETINRDILRLSNDKESLESDIRLTELKNIELDELYTTKASGYKENLNVVKREIQDGEQKLLELDLKSKARLETIETRENSLTIRERTLQQNELNLSSREKKLNMKLGLSQVGLK